MSNDLCILAPDSPQNWDFLRQEIPAQARDQTIEEIRETRLHYEHWRMQELNRERHQQNNRKNREPEETAYARVRSAIAELEASVADLGAVLQRPLQLNPTGRWLKEEPRLVYVEGLSPLDIASKVALDQLKATFAAQYQEFLRGAPPRKMGPPFKRSTSLLVLRFAEIWALHTGRKVPGRNGKWTAFAQRAWVVVSASECPNDFPKVLRDGIKRYPKFWVTQ